MFGRVQCSVQCGPAVGSSQSAGEGGGGGLAAQSGQFERTGKVVEKPAVGSGGGGGQQLVDGQ